MPLKVSLFSTLILWSLFAVAQTDSPDHDESHHEAARTRKILVLGEEERDFSPHRHDTVDKVDVLSKDRIQKAGATSLNEAIDRMNGVDSQDYCVNCGAKRISINGLRGDHTSVLVDGIPLYSAVTSVYGFDAISMMAVEEIEVQRGTGSALMNPEAIGGSINILTVAPKETGTRAGISYGTYNSRTADLLHNYVSSKYKLSLGGEFNRQQAWDTDENGMSESPWKSRYSFFAKQTLNLTESLQWTTRLSLTKLEIIGGNTIQKRLNAPITTEATDSDFVDGDVRKLYIGDVDKITESVVVQTREATSKLNYIVNSKNTLEWNLAGAVYKQKSYYMHAYDYTTTDTTLYTDLKWKHQLAQTQILTLGTSARKETLRSESFVMYDTNAVPKDNFDYTALSLFAQHEWLMADHWEMATALRAERLDNTWSYLNTLDKIMVSPRWLLKWTPNEHWTQQIAYGYGYRMPLTSIESAHGAYDGFIVDITELEKSHSLLYSLSYNTPTHYITPSVHYTRLENMAYPEEPAAAHSGPLRFINDTDTYDIVVYDLLTGYKPVPAWLLEVGFEHYSYPNEYKAKLPTAAIEQRVNLRSEVEKDGYTWVVSGMWVGARDLSKYYMYEDHYNVSDGLLGASDPKMQKSPAYWQWDSSLSKRFKDLELMVSVQNIFYYTQAKAGDTPAMWHAHGNHTHLDNRHVWGPNRGREFNLRMNYYF